MVEGFVEVVARLVVLQPFAEYSSEQVKRVSTEVAAWLSNHSVSQRIFFSYFQSLDRLRVQVG